MSFRSFLREDFGWETVDGSVPGLGAEAWGVEWGREGGREWPKGRSTSLPSRICVQSQEATTLAFLSPRALKMFNEGEK